MSDEPATKKDLQELRAEMASKRDLEQLRTELRTEMGGLRADMRQMEQRLLLEIGHALNVAVEQIGSKVGFVDDKYRDALPQLGSLRRELDEHRVDFRLHKRPPAAAPKRSTAKRKPRAR